MTQPPSRRRLRALVTLLVVVVALAGTQLLRVRLGLEWSAESIQQAVRSVGLWAPLGYLTLVVFRQLLGLPSVLVLTAAGLLFGAGPGAVLGAAGIVMNASALFSTARLMGRDWVLPLLQKRFPDVERRAETAGPVFIAFMTGHPIGLMTPFHFAAGVTGISWVAFLAAVGPAAALRAAAYSFLGAHLLDSGSPGFWLATAVLTGLALLPLAHPAFRRRLLARN